MMSGGLNTAFWIIIGVTVVILAIPLAIRGMSFWRFFTRELKYIEIEIERTEGREQKYWKKKKKKLLMSLIPFVRY